MARSVALAAPVLALALLPSALGGPSADVRLEGTWRVSLAFTIADGVVNRKVGDRVTETWRFLPRCAKGACAVELRRGGRPLVLRRSGSTYRAVRPFYGAFYCNGKRYPRGTLYVESWSVRVVRSKPRARGRTATRIAGVGTTAGRSLSGFPCEQVTSRERVELSGAPTAR